MRRGQPDRARVHDLPGTGHPHRHRAQTKGDQDKLGIAIQRLAEEDPTFHVRSDEETGQTIIGGMGELHLEVLVDRMKREFKVEANVGKPQVAYRETIAKRPEGRLHPQERTVAPASSPRSRSTSLRPLAKRQLRLRDRSPRSHPREYIPSVDAGAQEAMENGVLAGYPMVDIKVTLQDGTFHDVDSSDSRSRSPVPWRSRRQPARPVR